MTERFILLPPAGVAGPTVDTSVLETVPLARSTESPAHTVFSYRASWEPEDADALSVRLTVVDAVGDDGPKLVELSDEAVLALRAAGPPVRLEPIREYRPTVVAVALPVAPPPGGASGPVTLVTVRCGRSGTGIADVHVTAIVDLALNIGAYGVTDANGEVELRLGPAPVVVAELRVERPPQGWYGAWAEGLTVKSSHAVDLEPIDLSFASFKDGLRYFYGASPPGSDGAGVRVAVVDTGIDLEHPDLTVHGGMNTAFGEPLSDYGDNGLGHGTHVAGIIAARGTKSVGVRGLAPDVELWSFRVYGEREETATNWAIAKALVFAVHNGCHLINLSLGAMQPDQVLKEAIDEAELRGAVVIAAAGNEFRQEVAVPACYANAVTAFGRDGTYPPGAREAGDVGSPLGSDRADFIASFSNCGHDVDFTAPGVGIVSTVPGGYAPDRGTSMAAAATTGMAARLLSAHSGILGMSADANRARAILNLLASNTAAMGFGLTYEGYGML